MASSHNIVEQDVIIKVGSVSVGMTSAVVLARFGLQLLHPKRLMGADYFVIAAFVFYVTMCVLYISISPCLKQLYRVAEGKIPPYPGISDEIIHVSKMIFAAPCMFWMTLWCVKASLLLLYRKLLCGVPRIYKIIWWVIVGSCILSHIGNYTLYFRSCGTSITGFWKGGCEGSSRRIAQLVSLYYSFTADTSTNVMIMALPMRLTWGLKMPRTRKTAIILLFATGVICIMVATLRVAQVAANEVNSDHQSSLDPTWLGIWCMVECSIAVIIGCCPAFAVLFNTMRKKQTSYSTHGYRKQTMSRSGQGEDIHLKTIGAMTSHNRASKMDLDGTDLRWVDIHGSQEKLTIHQDGIMVSRTIDQSVTSHKNSVGNV